MKVLDFTNRDVAGFEEFAGKFPQSVIWQSHLWGEFQACVPYRGKFWALGVADGDTDDDADGDSERRLIMTVLVVRHAARLGYCRLEIGRGPVFDEDGDTEKALRAWHMLLEYIRQIAKKERALFLRVAPRFGYDMAGFEEFFNGFQEVSRGAFPEWTLRLDLRKSEEDLLADMKQKGRYNLRLAEKKGVRVLAWDGRGEDGRGESGFSDFYAILKRTGRRDGFSSHDASYYRAMLETLGKYDAAGLYLAYHPEDGERVIGGIIVTYFGDTATYYYGASDHEYRELMAPYALQWHAIREAKRRGCRLYDFFGVSGEGDSVWERRLSGVTRFKEQFGGEHAHYMKTRELVFRPVLARVLGR